MKSLNTKLINKLAVFIIAAITLFSTTKTHAQSELWCMEFLDATRGITLGDNGTIKQTIDGGASWKIMTSGTTNTLKKSAVLPDDDIVVVGFNGTIIRSTDYGNSWSNQYSGTTADLYGVAFGGRDSQVGVAVGSNGLIMRTSDQGKSWSQVSASCFDGLPIKPGFVSVSFGSESKGIVVGDNGKLLLTSDGGLTWGLCPTYIPNVNYKFVIMLSEDVAYATGENGVIIKTTNSGLSWVTLITNSTSTLYRIRFADDQHAISVGTSGDVILTTDGGLTWDTEPSSTAKDLNCLFVYDDYTAFTGGAAGIILKTTDGGETWFDGTKQLLPKADVKNSAVKLFPNYPNPSNPTTTIKYYIASASVVTLKIYDAAGKEVRTLVSRSLSAGMYSTLFDGTNLPSGVYYCKLVVQSNAGIFNQTTKIVLVK